MPAPMMMASKSGIGVAPVLVVWSQGSPKAIRSRGRWTNPAWTRGRVAGLPPAGPGSALLATASAPIVGVQIARQAATARGEGSDGPGAAAQADVDRRQRSPPLSGRHLAAAVCATAPRRSRALLRGLAVRAVLVGDALRRHFCGRARSRELFVEFGTRRYSGGRPAQGAGAHQLHPHGPARPYRATTHRRADRGAVQPRQFRAADPQADLRCAGCACRATRPSTGPSGSRPISPT